MDAITAHPHGIETYSNNGILAGYSNMETGNVGKRFGDLQEVIANRLKVRAVVGEGSYVVELVEHSAHITDLGNQPQLDGMRYTGDGLFTSRSDVILEVIVSDCIGMVIYDGKHAGVIGLIHVGRKGATNNIHIKALEYITTGQYQVPLEDIRIFLPPSIRKESYYFRELPPELQTGAWVPFVNDGHVDLVGRVTNDLLKAGLRPEQIAQDTTDVGAPGTPYFSHVLQKKGLCPLGRNAVVARLLPM